MINSFLRIDNRAFDSLRDIKVTVDYLLYPLGSVLIEAGNTKVICNVSVEDRVPFFMKNSNSGWLTAEYSMLPASTVQRKKRDINSLKKDSRASEIQRLIGRALRNVIDLEKIGERTITVDCDVLQADGGTRTLSITGGYIALKLAVNKLIKSGVFKENPIKNQIAAISLGIIDEQILLDMDYREDSCADSDINIVMDKDYNIIEIQATAENEPINYNKLDDILNVAKKGISELLKIQNDSLKKELVLASNNEHKIVEIKEILKDFNFNILSMKEKNIFEDINETADTLEGNSLIKAKYISNITSSASLADDTGLFIDALNGEPGVHSKRYSKEGTDDRNIEIVLEKLKNVPLEDRTARFRTVMTLILDSGRTIVSEGVVEGKIAFKKRGTSGFGYDSIFIENSNNMTMAEMDSEMKNSISHRKRALEGIREKLENLYKDENISSK